MKDVVVLTDRMEGFEEPPFNYKDYEHSFRRWLISQMDAGNLTLDGVRTRFELHHIYLKRVIKRWQELYSDELHLSLELMSSKDRAEVKKLEERIEELEKKLELAQMKNIALNTMIDIAEADYKLSIRKSLAPNSKCTGTDVSAGIKGDHLWAVWGKPSGLVRYQEAPITTTDAGGFHSSFGKGIKTRTQTNGCGKASISVNAYSAGT